MRISMKDIVENNVEKTQEKGMDLKTKQEVAKGVESKMDALQKAFAKQMSDAKAQEVLEKKPEVKEMLKDHVLVFLSKGGWSHEGTLLKGKRNEDGTYTLQTVQVAMNHPPFVQVKASRTYTGTLEANKLKLKDEKGKELKQTAELYAGPIYPALEAIDEKATMPADITKSQRRRATGPSAVKSK